MLKRTAEPYWSFNVRNRREKEIEKEVEQRTFKMIRERQEAAAANLNHTYLQDALPDNSKDVNFATFEQSSDTLDKKPEDERPEPLKQQEEKIPAHFYHKLGPRDVAKTKAKANKNKTVFTS